MAFTIEEVLAGGSHDSLDIRESDFVLTVHQAHDIDSDDFTGFVLKAFFVGGDEAFALDKRLADQLVVLCIDHQEDSDHAFID